jgi:hypothetical protein
MAQQFRFAPRRLNPSPPSLGSDLAVGCIDELSETSRVAPVGTTPVPHLALTARHRRRVPPVPVERWRRRDASSAQRVRGMSFASIKRPSCAQATGEQTQLEESMVAMSDQWRDPQR